MGSSPLEYRRDCIGERLYASRNYNDLRHVHQAAGANRINNDFVICLRQVRKKAGKQVQASASAPTLHTSEVREGRRTDPQAAGHSDGPYQTSNGTVGRYQNVGNTHHLLGKLARVSSGTQNIDWTLNLRDGLHQQPEVKWRRYFTRPQQSFDMMKENCASDNAAYQKSAVTPHDRRPDLFTGSISIGTIRSDPISFKRMHGCEGTNVSQWRHLIDDRSHGLKSRRQLAFETTLREDPRDPNGARICDNRSDGCITEMLGKKQWVGSRSHEPLAQDPPEGDPKLHHLSKLRIIPVEDEENRYLRMSRRQPRLDVNISDKHPAILTQEARAAAGD